MKKKHIRISLSERIMTAVICIIMLLAVLLCLYPFYYMLIYSLSDPDLARQGVYLWPRGLNLDAYKWVLEGSDFGHAFLISVARTVCGTALTIFGSSLFAYLVTKQEMLGRKIIYRYVIITMYLNAGLIPWFITMKSYHLGNTFWLYIIPGIINAYYVILIKTFIEQIPASLEESAMIDGAGFFKIYRSIILPLSKPIIATITVYAAVGQWNSWQDNYFLANVHELQTVQLILYNTINEAQRIADSMKSGMMNVSGAISITSDTIRMATTVVSVVPIMLVYPFMQRYFVKGVMMGAVKG